MFVGQGSVCGSPFDHPNLASGHVIRITSEWTVSLKECTSCTFIAAACVPWPPNSGRKFVKDTKQGGWKEKRRQLHGNVHILEKDVCVVVNRLLGMFVIFSQ